MYHTVNNSPSRESGRVSRSPSVYPPRRGVSVREHLSERVVCEVCHINNLAVMMLADEPTFQHRNPIHAEEKAFMTCKE